MCGTTSRELSFSCSQEDDGWGVYGPGLDELEDIIPAMQVVHGLDWIFSSKMAVAAIMMGAEVGL